MSYPSWSYFPRNTRPPSWALNAVQITADIESIITTVSLRSAATAGDSTSDAVLAQLRPGLETLGYQVESGKSQAQKIVRPVLFGNDGKAEVSYEIDAFHDGLGVAVEVEAGRGAANGADYRDIVRTSLLLDAEYLALFMPVIYRFTSGGKPQEKQAYTSSLRQLEAIYASRRLTLPFSGVLLVGY